MEASELFPSSRPLDIIIVSSLYQVKGIIEWEFGKRPRINQVSELILHGHYQFRIPVELIDIDRLLVLLAYDNVSHVQKLESSEFFSGRSYPEIATDAGYINHPFALTKVVDLNIV